MIYNEGLEGFKYEIKGQYERTSNSYLSDMIALLLYITDAKSVKSNLNDISHSFSFDFYSAGDKTFFTYKTKEKKVSIAIPSSCIRKQNIAQIRIFTYFGAEYLRLNEAENRDKKDIKIKIHIDEIVRRGIFTTRKAALKGFDDFSKLFMNIELKTESKKGRVFNSESFVKLTASRKSECYLMLSLQEGWRALASSSMYYPLYGYSLRCKTTMLLRAVLYYARCNMPRRVLMYPGINYLDIPFKSIAARLNIHFLTVKYDSPRASIVKPVEEAVKELNEAEKNYSNYFNLELITDPGVKHIQDYLNNTRIRVTFIDSEKNLYMYIFTSIGIKREKHLTGEKKSCRPGKTCSKNKEKIKAYE